MYGFKKKGKSKIKKNWEIHTETIFLFCHTGVIFFVIFAFMQKFEYMYFFCKERLSLAKERKKYKCTV
jgi:hypothetical protein